MSEAEEVKNVEVAKEGEAPSSPQGDEEAPKEDQRAKEEKSAEDKGDDADDNDDPDKDGEEKDDEDDDKGDREKENQDKEVANKEPNEKKLKDMEKQEEAKLRAKYPDMKSHGASSFLQKRLSKGNKYFDSGDYNMAKAKVGSTKPLIGPGQKVVLPGPTGDAIPTPESVPHKKISNLQSKLVNLSWVTCCSCAVRDRLRTRLKNCTKREKITWKFLLLAIPEAELSSFVISPRLFHVTFRLNAVEICGSKSGSSYI